MDFPENTSPVLEAIRYRLDSLEQGEPQLAGPLAFYRKLLPVLRTARPLATPLSLDLAAAQDRLAAGRPLLLDRPVSFAPDPTRAFFRRVCEVIAEFQPSTQEVSDALENDRLDLPALLASLASGDLERIDLAAETAEVSPMLLRMLLEYTLRPTLRTWAKQFEGQLDLESWQRTICPICASPPTLAELQGPKRVRFLRCGICGSAWPYPCLQCALCGNDDPRTQSLISADGEEGQIYAHTCKRCRGYIKSITSPTPPIGRPAAG